MEASIRKENDHQVTLILDGRLDTSVTQETELEVEPLFDYIKGLQDKVYDVFMTTGFVHLFQFRK